ncbi:hypothetical protein ACFSE1_06015 [Rhizobium helianthi]|uniref:Transmembrane protein n=1 Tax=Rhizobium helianthi TaxID=1132695 RepID=A0ABW4M4A3_9HYPH
MSSANDRLNEVLLELPKYKSQWESYVANPYVRAYDLAVQNFTREAKAQAERDRTKAELFVLGASILTGSVMMAAFATTSVRVLAGRTMLNVVCNNNLNRTFDMLHAASTNKTLMFALGSVMDEAKKLAGNHVKKAAETFTSSAPMASAATAINYKTRIEDFINANHICVHDLVQGVRDDRLINESGKNRIAELTRRIPFCNPPSGRKVDEQRLSQKMELLFYMASVLDSDELVQYAPAMNGSDQTIGRTVEYSSSSINQMPSASDYPKETLPRLVGRPTPHYQPGQRIRYKNIGGGIRDRIDLLSLQTGNGKFYPDQNMLEKFLVDPTQHAQIMKAEQVINRLSADARPRALTEVRMM